MRQPIEGVDHRVGALSHQGELTHGCRAARIRQRTLLDRMEERGDADHEELVEIRCDDGSEPGPVEQRRARVRGLVEHALVEGQP